MSRLSERIKLGGRKYTVVLYTLELGFALGLIGLLVATLEPEISQYVAAIVGSFGLLGSASIVAYNGANAAQDWHSTTGKPTPPQPRQSGMVQVTDDP